MIKIPENKELILFDGICNLCDNSIQFIIKQDKTNRYLFAPLQGETAQYIIKKYQVDTSQVDSIILYQPEKGIFFKSTAALKIASKLKFPFNILGVFLIVPSFIRNWVYDFIAKNRYQWYGKKNACMIPTPELKEKFLN